MQTAVISTFQKRPAYRYIRETDKLPRYDELSEADGHRFDTIRCKVKLFNPTGSGSWWIAAYDPETETAWGVAEITDREVGAIYMPELVEFRGRFGLPIERDLSFKPTTIAELMKA